MRLLIQILIWNVCIAFWPGTGRCGQFLSPGVSAEEIARAEGEALLDEFDCDPGGFGKGLSGYADGCLDRLRLASASSRSSILRALPRDSKSPEGHFVGSGAVFSRDWKQDVTSTVFWVGEKATAHSPSNERSAWDRSWMEHYGGYDDPANRTLWYSPLGFRPRLNPFYVALPYCDVVNGRFRPEASTVIPWFSSEYRGGGISVCKDHWVAIYARGKVAFAQWEDVGPFTTDDWRYVFGPDSGPTLNSGNTHHAGIDVSPAVRNYLGLSGVDQVNWRFVDRRQVSAGPWLNW